jgi:hypothetical protein
MFRGVLYKIKLYICVWCIYMYDEVHIGAYMGMQVYKGCIQGVYQV